MGPASGTRGLVVVGVDGSKSSSTALEWAAKDAKARGATLKVVHAWEVPAFGYGPYDGPTDWSGWRDDAARNLDEQVNAVLGDDTGIDIVREVKEGSAARVLLDEAAEADLLVVGSRGRGGFAGLLLGSVSAQLAHHAPCPVTIVRGQETG